jgi:hypothetical protein
MIPHMENVYDRKMRNINTGNCFRCCRSFIEVKLVNISTIGKDIYSFFTKKSQSFCRTESFISNRNIGLRPPTTLNLFI